MKVVLTVNVHNASDKFLRNVGKYISAQIELHQAMGWSWDDLLVVTNGQMQINCPNINAAMNTFCLTGSKMWGIQAAMRQYPDEDVFWSHDLDVWPMVGPEVPSFADVGLTRYRNPPEYQGGSIWWRKSAMPIVQDVIDTIYETSSHREEPILNRVLPKYGKLVTVLNSTWNVGISGLKQRYQNAEKPVKAVHVHPDSGFGMKHFKKQIAEAGMVVPAVVGETWSRWFHG